MKGDSKHEVLQTLKKTYLTHRQIGACEATYRLLPNLHMKDSNVTCTFVSTGFPENRATFMEKVHDDCDEDIDVTESTNSPSKYIKIEGKKGYYKKRISIHERYAQRPKALDKMCLAQFAAMYKVATYSRKNIVMTDNSSDLTGTAKVYLTDTELPVRIQFSNDEMSPMQLRGRASVIRLHESKKKKEEHEYYYSELLLFHPWRNEILDLHRHSSDNCKKSYKKNFQSVCDRRKLLFPFLDSVEEAQARLEAVSLQPLRTLQIGRAACSGTLFCVV